MPKTLQYVLNCYRALLWLYPAELRHAYGPEMTYVFEQVLRAEWSRRGVRGVAVSGCRAVGELFTVAIPGQLMSERMISAGLGLAINSAILALLVGLMMWPRYKFL
jgi:hypothetical protein